MLLTVTIAGTVISYQSRFLPSPTIQKDFAGTDQITLQQLASNAVILTA